MPNIKVEMVAGRTIEQKRALAKKLTEAFIEVAGGKPDSVQVLFIEFDKQNWSKAGQLFSDRDAPPAAST